MEEIIKRFSNEIAESHEVGERGDIVNWNSCIGILITRDMAEKILDFLIENK